MTEENEATEESEAISKSIQINRILDNQVYSEGDLLDWLDISKKTLDVLRREKHFPYVRLSSRDRVYMTDDVIAWLKKQSQR
jgi:hypothetical protein